MRVLVAGATGAIGRPLIERLVRQGHSVFALTRSTAKVELIRGMEAEPIVGDGLDAKSVHAAVKTARPDVIVHQMTALAGVSDLRHFDAAFAASNRLRTQGVDNVLGAAKELGVRRVIAQSFCGWPYARSGGPLKAETDPLDPSPPEQMRRTLDAIYYLERAVTNAQPIEGVALRYGGFYGPHTGAMDDSFVEQIRRRRFPLIGRGQAWWSFVHVEDAADATVAALDRGSGIYNIVDDDPAQVCEWLPSLASMLGAKPPWSIPAWLANLLTGDHLVVMMTQVRAGSNEKAKRELGWEPKHPSWRQGFEEIVVEMAERFERSHNVSVLEGR